MAAEPKTLQEAIVYFSNPDNCVSYLVAHRTEWKNGVICPTCGSKDVGYVASRRLWQCKARHPKSQFSVKVGTIMEDSALGLDKWLTAIWMQTKMVGSCLAKLRWTKLSSVARLAICIRSAVSVSSPGAVPKVKRLYSEWW